MAQKAVAPAQEWLISARRRIVQMAGIDPSTVDLTERGCGGVSAARAGALIGASGSATWRFLWEGRGATSVADALTRLGLPPTVNVNGPDEIELLLAYRVICKKGGKAVRGTFLENAKAFAETLKNVPDVEDKPPPDLG